jgi:hypothetical protein
MECTSCASLYIVWMGRNEDCSFYSIKNFNALIEGWTYHFMRPVFWVMRPNLQDTGLKKRDGFETHVPFFRTHVSYFRATVSKNETPKMAHLDFKRQFCLESKVPNALIST